MRETVADLAVEDSTSSSEPTETKTEPPDPSMMEIGQTIDFKSQSCSFTLTRIDPISWVLEQAGRSDYKRWGDLQQTNQDLAYIDTMGEIPVGEAERSLRTAALLAGFKI